MKGSIAKMIIAVVAIGAVASVAITSFSLIGDN